jgi:hypothetical protein
MIQKRPSGWVFAVQGPNERQPGSTLLFGQPQNHLNEIVSIVLFEGHTFIAPLRYELLA